MLRQQIYARQGANAMPDLAIGFDFGTSNSAVAVADPATGRTRLLHLDGAKPDSTLIPTLLYIERDGSVHLGYDAIDSFVRLEAGRTIVRQQVATEKEIDTVFGRELVRIDVDISQPGRFFQSLKSFLADQSYGGTKVFGQFHTLEDLVAIILREMRERAEAETGQAIRRATVGRPVHWAENDPERDALAFARMHSALRLAGFEDVTFVPEPIAAGLHFAATLPAPRNVLVFDFGGGTLDVTVMRIGGGERTVLSTAGTPLGGNTLDEDIMDGRLLKYFGEDLRWGEQGLPMPRHILDTIRRWYTIPVLNDARIIEFLRRLQNETTRSSQRQVRALIALVRGNYGWPLFREIERAKIGLSTREQERIGFFAEAIAISEPLPRRAFEALIGKRVRQAERCIDDALAAANLEDSAIDAVLRTGGSSTIPRFQRLLTDRFGADKLHFQDAFTSVATGLALSDAGQVAALPAA
jgi:hypothetical chaperone protein